MNFADRIAEIEQSKQSVLTLGVDPHLEIDGKPGLPEGYSLARFCCEVMEACAQAVVAVKLQLAFFEARGVEGMRALAQVIAWARRLGLVTIADAKRADIASTSAAYAEAYLGEGEFGCDAITVNPYMGTDALTPFFKWVERGRGVFVILKTSNAGASEFQDLPAPDRPLWEIVAQKVNQWGSRFVGRSGLSSVGAVVGATYPEHSRRARALMPQTLILAPGYGAQGADANDALAGAMRRDLPGIMVNASRSIMYAYLRSPGLSVPEASARAAQTIRTELNRLLHAKQGNVL